MTSRYVRARRAEARWLFVDKLTTALGMVAIAGVSTILVGWTIFSPMVQSARALIAVFL